MAAQSDIAEVIKSLQADITTIVKGEVELAKAELLPQAKAAGKGAGFFGAAAYAGLSGAALLFTALSFWLSLGYQSWFDLGMLGALGLGFGSVALVFLLIASGLALIGKAQLNFTPPEATVTNAEQTVESVKAAIAKGKADVDALPLSGRRPELES